MISGWQYYKIKPPPPTNYRKEAYFSAKLYLVLLFYNFLIVLAGVALKTMALFNPKIRLFVKGRKDVFSHLSKQIQPGDRVVWMHAASLGEFEQGLPVLQRLTAEKPGYKLVVTFFSPSGYEVKKNSAQADVITYLPLDSQKNVRKFLDIVHPEIALFIKYEFWPNYLNELEKRRVRTFLVSGIFRPSQIFFKGYGGFMRRRLRAFEHFFVQDEASREQLCRIGFDNVTVSGDTRFDRVLKTREQKKSLSFIETFLQGSLCVVIGSSWEQDEALLVPFINAYEGEAKFIIAPHLTDAGHIEQLTQTLTRETVLFSEKEGKNLADYPVFILNTVGLLADVYGYADVAYIGGGMGTKGLHNILEPAVFGVPLLIGKNYEKFPEAVELVKRGGVMTIKTVTELALALNQLLHDEAKRGEAGAINVAYVEEKSGAVEKVMGYLSTHSR